MFIFLSSALTPPTLPLDGCLLEIHCETRQSHLNALSMEACKQPTGSSCFTHLSQRMVHAEGLSIPTDTQNQDFWVVRKFVFLPKVMRHTRLFKFKKHSFKGFSVKCHRQTSRYQKQNKKMDGPSHQCLRIYFTLMLIMNLNSFSKNSFTVLCIVVKEPHQGQKQGQPKIPLH